MSEATLYAGETDYDSIVLRWLVIEKEAPIAVKRLGSHNVHQVEPPYLIDHNLQLFDHWVILEYLQERYPMNVFMPVDPAVRAQIRQICSMIRAMEVSQDELNIMLGHHKNFLLGDTFTLADIYAGVRYDIYDNNGYKNLAAYIDRLNLMRSMQEAR